MRREQYKNILTKSIAYNILYMLYCIYNIIVYNIYIYIYMDELWNIRIYKRTEKLHCF